MTCACNASFRSAEDYRDHLPCYPTVKLTLGELEALWQAVHVLSMTSERADREAVETLKALVARAVP